MAITAQMVSQLREQTGAGMMDCKKALEQADGDVERARDILRAKGQAGAEKRAGRSAAEGIVTAVIMDSAGAIVELNCETDFVARNEEFTALAGHLALAAGSIDNPTTEAVLAVKVAGVALETTLDEARQKMRENLVFKRCARYAAGPNTVLSSYIHTVTNKIGVLLELRGNPESSEIAELARGISMHIAASRPIYVTREDVPTEAVEREKAVLAEKTRNEGKPEAAIEKIVMGRLGKFYEQICLVEQPYVRDTAHTVGELLKQAGCEAVQFTLYVVGQE